MTRLVRFCLFGGTLFWVFLLGGSLQAQEARLQINGLEKLAAKAAESVDINLDGPLLQLAAKFLSDQKPDEARIKQLIAGLQGIYVRSYEFDKEGEYTQDEINAIRDQTRKPGWSKLVSTRSTRQKENVDIFLRMEGDKMLGLAVLCTEPKELTIVNIIGKIDLDKLSDLEGQFGIPHMGLKKDGKQSNKKE